MRYFYDTEFIEDGKTIRLLSIGVVAEDGREFYRVARDSHSTWSDAANHEWLRAHVLPSMPGHVVPHRDHSDYYTWLWDEKHPDYTAIRRSVDIGKELHQFLLDGIAVEGSPDSADIELWADYGAYDHVALCQLYGRMVDLPSGMPMWTHDFQQELAQWHPKLRVLLPRQTAGLHNALADARHLKAQCEWLAEFEVPH